MAVPDAGLHIDRWDPDGVVLLDLAGELTAREGLAMADAVDVELGRPARNLQVGLRHVTFIDSGGRQALVPSTSGRRPRRCRCKLLGLPVRVRRMLDDHGTKRLFHIIE